MSALRGHIKSRYEKTISTSEENSECAMDGCSGNPPLLIPRAGPVWKARAHSHSLCWSELRIYLYVFCSSVHAYILCIGYNVAVTYPPHERVPYVHMYICIVHIDMGHSTDLQLLNATAEHCNHVNS